jgi:hypothetical protein
MTTIKIYGISLEVYYDYHPAEAQTRDYPGCSEGVEITEVLHRGDDITALLESGTIEMIEEAIMSDRHASADDWAYGQYRDREWERNNDFNFGEDK